MGRLGADVGSGRVTGVPEVAVHETKEPRVGHRHRSDCGRSRRVSAAAGQASHRRPRLRGPEALPDYVGSWVVAACREKGGGWAEGWVGGSTKQTWTQN